MKVKGADGCRLEGHLTGTGGQNEQYGAVEDCLWMCFECYAGRRGCDPYERGCVTPEDLRDDLPQTFGPLVKFYRGIVFFMRIYLCKQDDNTLPVRKTGT